MFRDELGTLKGMTVKLHVDPEATPRFFKPRSVPYAMKGKVEEELGRLQKLGIIEPVQFSRWVAPIVPGLKEDKTARIYGDYKLTVSIPCHAKRTCLQPWLEVSSSQSLT